MQQLQFPFYNELRCEHFFPFGEWIYDQELKKAVLVGKCNKCKAIMVIDIYKKHTVWGTGKLMSSYRKNIK